MAVKASRSTKALTLKVNGRTGAKPPQMTHSSVDTCIMPNKCCYACRLPVDPGSQAHAHLKSKTPQQLQRARDRQKRTRQAKRGSKVVGVNSSISKVPSRPEAGQEERTPVELIEDLMKIIQPVKSYQIQIRESWIGLGGRVKALERVDELLEKCEKQIQELERKKEEIDEMTATRKLREACSQYLTILEGRYEYICR